MRPEDDIRGTPQYLFDEKNARWNFDLDACATHLNAKCPMYFTEQGQYAYALQNGIWVRDAEAHLSLISKAHGLNGSWAGRRVWCNPPYSAISEWLTKAWFSGADMVYMLVPSTRTEQPWWHEMVEPFRDGRDSTGPMRVTTDFIAGRHKFVDENNGPIYRKNEDGSLWLHPETGKPQIQCPMFGLVGVILERNA
jgi:hypothetical protein